jgi:hypothetical protein
MDILVLILIGVVWLERFWEGGFALIRNRLAPPVMTVLLVSSSVESDGFRQCGFEAKGVAVFLIQRSDPTPSIGPPVAWLILSGLFGRYGLAESVTRFALILECGRPFQQLDPGHDLHVSIQ